MHLSETRASTNCVGHPFVPTMIQDDFVTESQSLWVKRMNSYSEYQYLGVALGYLAYLGDLDLAVQEEMCVVFSAECMNIF